MKKKILISILVIVVIVAAVFGYYIYRMWPMLSTTMGDVELTEDHQSHRITEETTSKGSETEMTDRADESKQVSGGTDYTLTTKVVDVINDPVFGDYGRLIFPADRTIDENLELQDVGDILIWYNNVNPDRTVEIANYLKDQASSGEQIFYDIYTDEEKAEDPSKEDTGLFFFRGEPPTYACVGMNDGIASYRTMENYISRIQADGTDAQIEVFDGMRHGFGLGEGTVAEGWLDRAVSFWERNEK